MILYHTSTLQIPLPDVYHSRNQLDCGRGFYLTTLRGQAEQYGQRFLRLGEPSIMNFYEFDEERPSFNSKVFDSYNDVGPLVHQQPRH